MQNLKDFFQGASNSIASNVSAPVDGIAWLLRKAGVPVPPNPMGGSDWMAEKGLTPQPQNRTAGLLGEAFGLSGPMVAVGKAPQLAKGLLQMGDNLAAPRTLNPQTGAVVWHGSPHKFDKFDSAKIGTGEGAQAYGNGLYLADEQGVASQYQRTLSAKRPIVGGEVADRHAFNMNIIDDAAINGKKSLVDGKQALVDYFKKRGVVDAAWGEGFALRKANSELAQAMALPDGQIARNTGSLYKVDLPDEQIAKMLDWDKPLSAQSEKIQSLALQNSKAMKKQLAAFQNPANGEFIPKTIYDLDGSDLLKAFGKGGVGEEALRQQGIPGIRYLDGGSRAGGAGSSNYVVFPGNESMLNILERNGKGLLD